jgi:hypothetical protein
MKLLVFWLEEREVGRVAKPLPQLDNLLILYEAYSEQLRVLDVYDSEKEDYESLTALFL